MKFWHFLLLFVVLAILVGFSSHSLILGAGTFIVLLVLSAYAAFLL